MLTLLCYIEEMLAETCRTLKEAATQKSVFKDVPPPENVHALEWLLHCIVFRWESNKLHPKLFITTKSY